jgi:hypothetical protein
MNMELQKFNILNKPKTIAQLSKFDKKSVLIILIWVYANYLCDHQNSFCENLIFGSPEKLLNCSYSGKHWSKWQHLSTIQSYSKFWSKAEKTSTISEKKLESLKIPTSMKLQCAKCQFVAYFLFTFAKPLFICPIWSALWSFPKIFISFSSHFLFCFGCPFKFEQIVK